MWESICHKILTRMIRKGGLRATYPSGRVETYGESGATPSEITVTDIATLRHMIVRPEVAVGEGYMDGTLHTPDLVALLTTFQINMRAGNSPAVSKLATRARSSVMRLVQRNDAATAKDNVAHHYDISDDFYRLFLDQDMQYSCAYWPDPDMTLEQAQLAKKHHIARKLLIKPGMRVLDIGCGWGGLAITLAKDFGAQVTGVTLSENQLATARKRVAEAGLSDKIDLRLLDYRKLDEQFDRVVSVGMLEHVGLPHYDEYFAKVRDLMTEDGVALIHSICKSGPPRSNMKWMDKYIFPGSYAPSSSEIYQSIERSWLYQTDDEHLRLHYSYTLKAWRERFEASHDTVKEMFDDRFIRMWRFYLSAMEVAFKYGSLHVQQWQLAKRMDAVPLTRDYLYANTAEEAQLAAE
jgi:cyclopropane-fatty-acyl-phospholipid synthase